MHVFGAKEITKMFNGLAPQVEKAVITKVNRKTVKPVTTDAKRGVRGASRQVAKSIGVRQKRYKGAVSTVVGPRSGFEYTNERGTKTNPTKIAHLIEQGTLPHFIWSAAFNYEDAEGFDRSYVGRVSHPGTKGVYFMRNAWLKNKNSMWNTYTRETARMIPIEAERYARRLGAKK